MLKHGWVRGRWKVKPLRERLPFGIALVLALGLMTACAASGAEPTPLPTQTLIPLTPTPSNPPPTQTPTSAPRLRPADLLSATPQETRDRLRAQVVQTLAAAEDVEPSAVQVVQITERAWDDAESLSCDVDSPVEDGDITGFEMILLLDETVYIYHTDDTDQVQQCSAVPVAEVSGDMLVKVDPIAEDTLALARQRLANERDLSTRQIALESMRVVTWPDNSLGCPAPGQDYAQVEINGYRLVLSVGDERYIYHTSFDQIIRCNAGNEELPPEMTPEPTAETTPESTPEQTPDATAD